MRSFCHHENSKIAVLMEEYPVKDFKLTQTAPECFVSFELRQ